MPASRRTSLASSASAIVLTTLAVLACAPRATAAGCSAWAHPAVGQDTLGLAALDELADASLPDAAAPGRIPPCSGPSCTEGPGVPLAPALVAPSFQRELWGRSHPAFLVDRSGRLLASPERPSPRPVVEPTDVERPPRRPAR